MMAEKSVMGNEGILTQRVLPFLDKNSLVRVSSVNTLFHSCSKSDLLWRRICEEEFRGYLREKQWLATSVAGGSWKMRFRQFLSDIRYELPIFAMRMPIERNRPMALNFFEPRYRMLVQRVDNISGDGSFTFCYCTAYPAPGVIGWITRIFNLTWTEGGCAQFIALPLAKCFLINTWEVEVPDFPGAPELSYCVGIELPVAE